MNDTKTKLEIAQKLANTYRKNIAFMEERLKIQAKPGYNPWKASKGFSEPQYHEIQVKLEKKKLAKAEKVIQELY